MIMITVEKIKRYGYSNTFFTRRKGTLHKNNYTSDYVHQYEHNL